MTPTGEVEMTSEPSRPGLALDHEHDRSLRVHHGGVELFRYVYRTWDPQVESPRPYFHPVRTLGGDIVTDYRPHDHVWHKGIAWSLPVVGAANFWGGGTYVHGTGYAQLANNGGMWHREFSRIQASPDRIVVSHALDWVTEPGERCVAEHRTFAVTLAHGAWTLVFDSAMTNVGAKPIEIGSPTTRGRPAAGYGGLFWRGPRGFTGGLVQAPGRAGGDDLMGTRQPWLAFTGRHDGHGRTSTLVFVDSPDNPGHPTEWFVRSTQFPGVCPAPFFSAEVALPPGETLRLRYAVTVADGERGPDDIAALASAGLDAMKEVHR